MNRRSFLAGGVRAALVAPVLGRMDSFALEEKTVQRAAPTGVSLNVRDCGAKADGATKDTAAIQQALDRCAVLGGGEVRVPAGNYLTGALALRAKTTLRLDQDAVLEGSGDFADYPVTQVRWEGKWIEGHTALLYAIDATELGVTGAGKIVGNTGLGGRPNAQNPLRHPALMEFIRCSGVRLDGFSTSYNHMWSVHPTDCEDVTIRNLTIRSTGGNGDGIDIDSCRRVWIDGCDIATGDDCISLKSGRGEEGLTLGHATEEVRITHCTFADSLYACIGIGSETSGGIRGVRIEHCKFTHAQTYAIYIKTKVGRGAFIEDIAATDLDVSGMVGGFLRLNLLNSGLQDQQPVPGREGIPATANFRFSNVRVSDCAALVDGVEISPDKPLHGLTLENISGRCAKGISLANAKGVEIRNVSVTGYGGPLIGTHNVTGKGLKGAVTIEGPKVPAPIAGPVPRE